MAGKSAQGTTISRETSLGSGVYVVLGNVRSFDGPSTQNQKVDTTDLSAVAKTYTPGLVEYGDLSMDINYDPELATHQQAESDMEANPPTVTNWRITFPNPTRNHTWNAFVQSFSKGGSVDGLLTGKLSLALTGPRVVS